VNRRLAQPAATLARGLLTTVTTLACLLLVTFALTSLSPIDPALRALGDRASESSYAEMRHRMGLDAPWPQRFVHYAGNLLHGDLGVSESTGQPVAADLRHVFPATLELATLAMLVSTVLGVALGLVSAWRPRGLIDGVVRIVSLLGSSLPAFWLGLIVLYFFYARLHWAGGPGRLDDAYEYTLDLDSGFVLLDTWRSGVPGAFANAWAHLGLPVLVLAAYAIGQVTRMTRAALLGEASKEYVTLARAKGAGSLRILLHHLLPNTRGLIITVLALTYASLLEGAVLVETVFAWPGIGRYLTNALFAADTAAIVGATLVIGCSFVVINGLTDALVRTLDPRLR
jgi:peptide/nickel transport system permease protein